MRYKLAPAGCSCFKTDEEFSPVLRPILTSQESELKVYSTSQQTGGDFIQGPTYCTSYKEPSRMNHRLSTILSSATRGDAPSPMISTYKHPLIAGQSPPTSCPGGRGAEAAGDSTDVRVIPRILHYHLSNSARTQYSDPGTNTSESGSHRSQWKRRRDRRKMERDTSERRRDERKEERQTKGGERQKRVCSGAEQTKYPLKG